jgi:hypothetical protein
MTGGEDVSVFLDSRAHIAAHVVKDPAPASGEEGK